VTTSNASDGVSRESLKFGRYVTSRCIGSGGMGKVYCAQDPVLQRTVAVKVIVLNTLLDDKVRQEYLNRFSLEARASAKLNHPSIVAVYDTGEEQGVPWIAFEFVEGERLDNLLKVAGKLPVNEAVSIALDIAGALHHAHSHGIIHRDIKPSNIIIERSTGIAKLSDFGIAKAPWTTLTRDGDTVGSPGYMSPEQINGAELDPRTDLFSLGVVFYEMIAGKHPFLAKTIQSTFLATLNGTYMPLNNLFNTLPQAVSTVVGRCIKVDPQNRISSAQEFTALLIADPSLAGSQASGSREALGGMTQKIARAIVNGALHEHTKHRLRARYARLNKLYQSASETVADLGSIAASLIEYLRKKIPALMHKSSVPSPAIRKTQTSSAVGMEPGVARSASTASDIRIRVIAKITSLTGKYRLSKRQMIISVIVIIVAGINIPVLLSIISNMNDRHLQRRISEGTLQQSLDAAKELEKRGIPWSKNQLIARCREFLEKNDLELALMTAQKIRDLAPDLPHGYILLGRAALKSGDYGKARESFVQAKNIPGGSEALDQEHIQILTDLSQELMDKEAPQSLIHITVVIVTPQDELLISSWLESKNYWLRWNSVSIMQSLGKTADLVKVYMFDLKYGENPEIRIKAVRRLGETGDSRAIPLLKQAANRKKTDPLTAHTAQQVLNQRFK